MNPFRTKPRPLTVAAAAASEVDLTDDFRMVDGLDAVERRLATRNRYSPLVLLVTIVSTLGVLAYSGFLLNPANRGDWLPWILVIVAELILVFHALMSMWVMLAGYGKGFDYGFYEAQGGLYRPEKDTGPGLEGDPTRRPVHLDGREVWVDVFITVFGEDPAVIRRTVLAATAIRGLHQTWLLDDGDSDDVRDLAAELGCRYVRRLGAAGAKAGNINHALTIAKADFFCIFDADFVAEPEFLEETLPHMADPNVAFVQTPQAYGNLHNIISRGAGYMQSLFYRFVQPGRNQFNAAFCVGTNVLFRRTAVMDVGGMYTQSKSEDVWTSLLLHERGWRSVFVPERLATGDAPDTIEAYSNQQLRWATGGFEIMFTRNPLRRRTLTMDQRLMYFVTATHYLTGIVPGLLILVPALEIFFDLRPVNLSVPLWQWVLFYSGFYVMQVLLAAVIAGTFRWEVMLLASNSFPIYLKALHNAFLNVDTKWSVTGATGVRSSAFNFIRVQVWTFVFLVFTSAVSVWRDLGMSHFNLATFWCVINTLVVGAFLATAFAEDHAARRARPAPGVPRRLAGRRRLTLDDLVPVLDRDTIVEMHERRQRLVASGEPEPVALEPVPVPADRRMNSAFPTEDHPGLVRARNEDFR